MHSLAQRPRQVGISLKHLPRNPSEYFNIDNVPWQRVINSKGMISHRYVRTNQRKTSLVHGWSDWRRAWDLIRLLMEIFR